MGDFNTNDENNKALHQALSSNKWFDAALTYANSQDTSPAPTCFAKGDNPSRIDHIIVNQTAFALLTYCNTDPVLALPTHLALTAHFNIHITNATIYRHTHTYTATRTRISYRQPNRPTDTTPRLTKALTDTFLALTLTLLTICGPNTPNITSTWTFYKHGTLRALTTTIHTATTAQTPGSYHLFVTQPLLSPLTLKPMTTYPSTRVANFAHSCFAY